MPSKLETLRQIIIRANPSIMDLAFGCKIKGNQDNPTLSYVGANNLQHCLKIDRTSALLFVDKIKNEEIIGRPIQLHDALLAIKKRSSSIGWFEIKKRFEAFTDLENTGWENIYFFLIENWNLSLPLEEQEEGTWDFLLGVLGEDSSKEGV